MTQSRSRRIVLFLDCCYAGAFDRGMRARATKVMDLQERFGGCGRAVITASGALEYAFEGDRLTESGDPSPPVFTTAMVRGLTTGEAVRDQDGYIDLDELYDYVYEAVREVTPHQAPGKWTFGVQGDLVIARRNTPVTEPAALPPELQHSIDSPLAGVRAGAVDELARLLSGRHQGLALAVPTTRSRRRWWPATIRARVILAALAAATVLVGGVVTWRVLDQAGHSTTIPASFDGQWTGNRSEGVKFEAMLGEGLPLGELRSGASSCYAGTLTVGDATDSRLRMRFAPEGEGCNPWTVVFTHLSGGDLMMAVDPDSSVPYEAKFEVRMTRQG